MVRRNVRSGMNRRTFLGAAGAGAAGVAGAAMMGSGVVSAYKPDKPYEMYGALPDNIADLTVASDTNEFLKLVS